MTKILLSTILVGLSFTALQAEQVQLEVALANSYLEAGKPNSTYLKVGLTGFKMAKNEDRAPVNVSLVIDRSGSMSGGKITQAREAAKMAVERLQKDDIISIVAYDSGVEVLVPSTKLSDKSTVLDQIGRLKAKGSTALFAGVSKGASELRKFMTKEKVNRVILLSDGQANIGPKSPGELGELGASLVKEGISVSTIGLGLGYNEDLMTNLAATSDGNHIFVENENDLVAVFDREFGDILSIVAQEVVVEITLSSGVSPKRVIGRDADIAGQKIITTMNQLYSDQEKYIIVEIDVDNGKANAEREVAAVGVSYANMLTSTADELSSKLSVRFTADPAVVEKHINQPVMAAGVLMVATKTNEEAVKLRDQGRIEEARQALIGNAGFLSTNGDKLNSKELKDYGVTNIGQVKALNASDWGANRKTMRAQQITNYRQLGHGGYSLEINNSEAGKMRIDINKAPSPAVKPKAKSDKAP